MTLRLALLSLILLPLMACSRQDAAAPAADLPPAARDFLDTHCVGCHDAATKKGDLDLSALAFAPADAAVATCAAAASIIDSLSPVHACCTSAARTISGMPSPQNLSTWQWTFPVTRELDPPREPNEQFSS